MIVVSLPYFCGARSRATSEDSRTCLQTRAEFGDLTGGSKLTIGEFLTINTFSDTYPGADAELTVDERFGLKSPIN